MSAVVLALGALGAATGAALGALAARWPRDDGSLAARVDAVLPQTQCAQCGYPGCRPYAEAIAAGEAPIDRCPPGGDDTVARLARLLGESAGRVDPAYGAPAAPAVARIDEARCIGCALCLPACPVDAIIGAHRHTHTVLAAECTGCELCLPPCPVDCIDMRAPP